MGGLFGLLDDVAALARLAAASIDDIGTAAGRATTKAAGVLIDDAAVTPQYVQGLAAERELPIIARIARGSFRNKLLIVLPVLLLLSEFVAWLLTPLLMAGGGYLCYEAVHKIWGAVAGHGDEHGTSSTHAAGGPATAATHGAEDGAGDEATRSEDELVAGAIRTDLILSAEIMTIALDEVATRGFVDRALVLTVVAIAITVLVYGVVALIVKMDDVGLRLAQGDGADAELGRRLVTAMPRVLSVLAVVGTAAMLWVGGHIVVVGLEEFGVTAPADLLHALEDAVAAAAGPAGELLAWLAGTAAAALAGLLVGVPVVAVQQAVPVRSTGAH